MKKIISFLVIAFASVAAYAGEDSTDSSITDTLVPSRPYPTEFAGLYYSSLSGMGLSYLGFISERIALKFNGFVLYKTREDDNSSDNNINLGMEMQYSFYKTNTSRVYLALGGAYWYEEELRTRYAYEENLRKDSYSRGYSAGIAAGYEFMPFPGAFGRNIALNIMLSYQADKRFLIDYFQDNTSLKDSKFEIDIKGGMGVSYAF